MIGQFKKVRRISKRPDLILEAIKASDVVQVNADDTMIKRANPLPRDPVEALTRTIVIENLPPKSDEQSIKLMCEVVGQFQRGEEAWESPSSNSFALLPCGCSTTLGGVTAPLCEP